MDILEVSFVFGVRIDKNIKRIDRINRIEFIEWNQKNIKYIKNYKNLVNPVISVKKGEEMKYEMG